MGRTCNTHVGNEKCIVILVKNHIRRYHFRDLVVDGRWIIEKWIMRVWIRS